MLQVMVFASEIEPMLQAKVSKADRVKRRQ